MKKSMVWCFVAAMAVLAGGCGMAGAAEPMAGPSPELDDVPKELAVDLGGGVKLDLVLIPAGSFTMGDEKWATRACSQSDHYEAFLSGQVRGDTGAMGSGDGQQPEPLQGSEEPRGEVRWDDCQAFLISSMRRQVGRVASSYCLPRRNGNMPVERGARASFVLGTTRNNLANMHGTMRTRKQDASCGGEEAEHFWAVRHARERVGVVPGLVWWVRREAADDPRGPTTGSFRVNRGGSWSDVGGYCRSAYRDGFVPGCRAASWACVSPEFRQQAQPVQQAELNLSLARAPSNRRLRRNKLLLSNRQPHN